MNPYMAYDAVSTKISVKKSNAFDDKKLGGMMECETINQVTDYLKSKYGLAKLINNAGDSTRFLRDDVETLLTRYIVYEVEDILHYFSGPYKDFLKGFLMRFEIIDLVMLMRKIVKGEEIRDIEGHFVHSLKYSKLPFDKLAYSKNGAEFIENLRGTPYFTSLKTATDNDETMREFHSEMKLQLLFYKNILKRSLKLEKDDRQAAVEIIGTKIDYLNVQWIYRAKEYYDISQEQILIYSLQGGYKLGANTLKKLVYSKGIDELIHLSNKHIKYCVFGSEADIKKNLDNGFMRYLDSRKHDTGIGKVLWYYYMLDRAIRNLTTVTEGIRYKLSKREIEKYLIRKARKTEVM